MEILSILIQRIKYALVMSSMMMDLMALTKFGVSHGRIRLRFNSGEGVSKMSRRLRYFLCILFVVQSLGVRSLYFFIS
jgi:hypothetical protein